MYLTKIVNMFERAYCKLIRERLEEQRKFIQNAACDEFATHTNN